MVVCSLAVGKDSDKSQQTDKARTLKGKQKARPNNQKVDADSHGEMNRRKTGTWSQQTDRARRRKDRQAGRQGTDRRVNDGVPLPSRLN